MSSLVHEISVIIWNMLWTLLTKVMNIFAPLLVSITVLSLQITSSETQISQAIDFVFNARLNIPRENMNSSNKMPANFVNNCTIREK